MNLILPDSEIAEVERSWKLVTKRELTFEEALEYEDDEWSLPTIEEVNEIIDYEVSTGIPPEMERATDGYRMWTSTPWLQNKEIFVWGVNTINGSTMGIRKEELATLFLIQNIKI